MQFKRELIIVKSLSTSPFVTLLKYKSEKDMQNHNIILRSIKGKAKRISIADINVNTKRRPYTGVHKHPQKGTVNKEATMQFSVSSVAPDSNLNKGGNKKPLNSEILLYTQQVSAQEIKS